VDKTYRYSVIIPHYNSNGLIVRALDSIPSRADIQVLVIDDQSTQKCIQTISRCTKYSRVQFVFSDRKMTGGGARNEGLNRATGGYILFLDADDYFMSNAFDIFDQYSNKEIDLIMFKVSSFIEGTEKQGSRHLYLNAVYKKNGLTRFLSNSQPYAKMISRSFIEKEGIRFEECSAGDDIYFSTQVCLYSKSRQFVPSLVYMISQNSFSVTATMNEEKISSELRQLTKKVQLIKSSTSSLFSTLYFMRNSRLKYCAEIIADDQSTLSIKSSAASYNEEVPRLAWLWFRLLQRLKGKKSE